MNEIMIAIIGSSALGALITNIFNMLAANSRQKKVNQVLLLGELERRLDNYRARGFISGEQIKLFSDIAALYHDEGGDGYAEGLLIEARSLPRT